jgi:hypothetical protein
VAGSSARWSPSPREAGTPSTRRSSPRFQRSSRQHLAGLLFADAGEGLGADHIILDWPTRSSVLMIA